MQDHKMKNADGRDRRTPRSQDWDDLRCDATAQELKIRRGRKRLFSQHRWKDAEQHYLVSLPVILSLIKYGRENWIIRLWRRLRVQWSTSSTKSMARRMKKVMTQSGSSILYSLFSVDHSTVYDSLIRERPGIACMTEHSTATSDTNPVEQNYRGMKAAGGAAAWYFIPVVGGPVLPIRQLMALEDQEIGLHPYSWNEAGKKHRQKQKPSRPTGMKLHQAQRGLLGCSYSTGYSETGNRLGCTRSVA